MNWIEWLSREAVRTSEIFLIRFRYFYSIRLFSLSSYLLLFSSRTCGSRRCGGASVGCHGGIQTFFFFKICKMVNYLWCKSFRHITLSSFAVPYLGDFMHLPERLISVYQCPISEVPRPGASSTENRNHSGCSSKNFER